ncbi:MAG: ACP S-malonyltransferase [Eubacteriales bacterium]|nr:ACP S-malonyltransferase [Eubacteriales bacterium]
MGKVAFLFAGQGAQFPGMGAAFYEQSPAARQVFDLCESIRPGTLRQCLEGGADELSQTANTQPCLFAVDLACACALAEAGVTPDGAAGFSLGEVPAAAFCGRLGYEQAFRLVLRRGQWMQECADEHPGGMLAVLRLEPNVVEQLCAALPDAFPVNYNAPGQIVVSGAQESLKLLAEQVAERKGRALPLSVGGAFHTPYMHKASLKMAGELAGLPWRPGRLPLYANLTARPYPADGREMLAQQVCSPVLWQQTIQNMVADGYTDFIEVGAGRTLTGLMKKIDAQARAYAAETPAKAQEILCALGGPDA